MSIGDCFISIDGITGESGDSEFPDAIQVVGWDWGVEMGASTGRAGAATTSRADMKQLTFSHYYDASSPSLMTHCINNKQIKLATLVMRRAAGEQKGQKFLVIALKQARVALIAMQHSPGEEIPLERVSLAFEEMNVDYMQQSERGSDKTGKKSAGWRLHS
ncbi:MAG TPA: type VI secretion system tube protein Hcp [Burkholderiaceae bacterium]|jgi:type VI secretion system secreted protein Hcp|nr:type VI secretion system tube protein Hcp [Burkholderiaceae bacterium]